MNNIIFVEQYDNRIKLLSEYYSEPYTASWNKINEDEVSIISSKNIDLGSREYVLGTALGENYSLSVIENNKEIESYNFYTGNLTIKEHIDQIIQLYNIDMTNLQKEYRELIKKIESADWIDIFMFIFSLYQKANSEEKYRLYLLLDGLITRYNYNVECNNGKYITFDTLSSTITFDRPIKKAMFYSVNDQKRHFIINSFIEDSFKTKTLKDVIYKVYLYNDSNKMVSQFLYFEPNEEIKQIIRNNKTYVTEKQREAIENNLSVPSIYVDFIEEEKEYYQLEQIIRPQNIFIKLPKVYEDYPNIKFVFEEKKCLDFIKESSFNYFLVINEMDVLYDPIVNRRVAIDADNNYLLVNMRDYGIRNEPYFYYIEDENGTIVSDIHVLQRNDRSIETYDDYLSKKKEVRMLDLKKETNTTLQAIRSEDTVVKSVRKIIDKIQNDEELNELDLISQETIFLPSQYDTISKDLYALSVSQTLQGDYDKNICNEIKYTAKERKLALYSQKKYTMFSIIEVGAKNSYEYKETFVMGKFDTAVDFRISINTNVCIVRAIDLDTNKISGFVFIEYPNKTTKYYAKEYLIKLEGVE